MKRRLMVAVGAAAACLAPKGMFAQSPALQVVSKLEAEHPATFTCIAARELGDGRVIVADNKEKRLELLDFQAGTAVPIGRRGQGPGEWANPRSLVALPGDTTLVVDPGNGRYLTVLPSGAVGKTLAIPARGTPLMSIRGVDSAGRLYFQGNSYLARSDGRRVAIDSAAILRYDRRLARLDTVGFHKAPNTTIKMSGTGDDTRVLSTVPGRFDRMSIWSVAPDGRIVTVHAEPYRIEWVGAGAPGAGPPIDYTRVNVVQAEKEDAPLPQCGWAAPETIVAAMAKRAGVRISRPQEWPEYKAPYPPTLDAVVVDPQGELWVRLERPQGDDQLLYDVIDRRGQLSRRVQLPKGTQLVSFGRRTLYLALRDQDDLLHLQRYRLDGIGAGR